MDDPSTEPSNAQPGNEQPGHEQPGYEQPGYGQPGYGRPHEQAGYEQPYHEQPAYPPPSYPADGSAPGPTPQQAPAMFPYAGLAAPPVAPAREPWVERGDVRAAATVAGVLVVLGLVAGLLWAAISPHGSGVVVTKTEIVPFEQENWIAADGRFAIITAVIGLVAGLGAWFWKSRRGPVLAAGLAIGTVIGSLLTAVVGTLVSSGHSTGKINSGIRLHVVLHAHGLVAIEGVLALAAYLGGVLFAGPDDLGRPSGASLDDAETFATDPSAGWSAPIAG